MWEMLNGLDLFSGIGGLTLALEDWVRPIAYCEKDKYAQGVLLSRMSEGHIPIGPIWDQVESLNSKLLPEVEIIYGGFPCQDISVAGNGAGLEGERSGLFFEVLRLTSEIRPQFVFLENVPAIRTRGADTVIGSMAELGYDARWLTLSAASIGAPHRRERWWCLLADTNSIGRREEQEQQPGSKDQAEPWDDGKAECLDLNPTGNRSGEVGQFSKLGRCSEASQPSGGSTGLVHNTPSERLERWQEPQESWEALGLCWGSGIESWPQGIPQPAICGAPNGLPNRLDRVKCLGNAVVPAQAREAFRQLMFGGAK